MQTRIRRSDIDSFKTQAGFIKPNNTLPIYSYLKIEVIGDFCYIFKTNGQAFIQKTLPSDSEDCCFLIDEKSLYSFVEYCDGDLIEFSYDGNRIKMSCEKKKQTSPTEDVRSFPVLMKPAETWHVLPKLALVSAGICSNIIFDGEVAGPKSYVFLGRGIVAGCDGNIGFLQKIPDAPPIELVIRKEVAVTIKAMNSCEYTCSDSYDFFRSNDTLYGFVKNEQPYYFLEPIFDKIEAEHSFSMNKNVFIKFNKYCSSISPDPTLGAFFECNADILKFEMNYPEHSIDAHSEVYVKGNGKQHSFKFNPEIMNKLITVSPCEEIFFHPGTQRYYITDIDKSFIGVIMGIG